MGVEGNPNHYTVDICPETLPCIMIAKSICSRQFYLILNLTNKLFIFVQLYKKIACELKYDPTNL